MGSAFAISMALWLGCAALLVRRALRLVRRGPPPFEAGWDVCEGVVFTRNGELPSVVDLDAATSHSFFLRDEDGEVVGVLPEGMVEVSGGRQVRAGDEVRVWGTRVSSNEPLRVGLLDTVRDLFHAPLRIVLRPRERRVASLLLAAHGTCLLLGLGFAAWVQLGYSDELATRATEHAAVGTVVGRAYPRPKDKSGITNMDSEPTLYLKVEAPSSDGVTARGMDEVDRATFDGHADGTRIPVAVSSRHPERARIGAPGDAMPMELPVGLPMLVLDCIIALASLNASAATGRFVGARQDTARVPEPS